MENNSFMSFKSKLETLLFVINTNVYCSVADPILSERYDWGLVRNHVETPEELMGQILLYIINPRIN